MGRPFPGRLPEGLALYNGVPGSKEPYKDAHCSPCTEPGSSAEPQDPSILLFPHCPHDLEARPPHLVGRGFSGSEELSFSSCCQTEWGCSPEIPPGKGRRAAPTVSRGRVHQGGQGRKLEDAFAPFIWELRGNLVPRLGEGNARCQGQAGDPALWEESAWACPGCTKGGGRARAPEEGLGLLGPARACTVHRGRVCT